MHEQEEQTKHPPCFELPGPWVELRLGLIPKKYIAELRLNTEGTGAA
jgi:hypothetical protein